METRLHLDILPQPNNSTCGPTCLHAVYRHWDDELPLARVIREIPELEEGGTLAVLLGSHALARGYEATIYTYDLRVFDPTWFEPRDDSRRLDTPSETGSVPQPVERARATPAARAEWLAERLRAQRAVKPQPKLHQATDAYLEFLRLGGRLKMEDLTGSLIRRYLKRSIPILTGLSATYLYHERREYGPQSIPDDVRGFPAGHFVVLCGYDKVNHTVLVADPLQPNPLSPDDAQYFVPLDRVLSAIMLGSLTYDANLLIIEPAKSPKRASSAHSHRRQ